MHYWVAGFKEKAKVEREPKVNGRFSRNCLTTLNSVKIVLKYCKNKPIFITDRGAW